MGHLTNLSFTGGGQFLKLLSSPERALRSMANANGRTQHCWSVLLDPTCCIRLNGTAMLAFVAYSLKPVKSVCMGLKVTVQFDFEQYFWLMEYISVIS